MIDVVAYDPHENRIEFDVNEEEFQRLKQAGYIEPCDCSDDCPVWYARTAWSLTPIRQLLGRQGRPA